MQMQISPLSPAPGGPTGPNVAADQLEQAFLEEMLKYCGPRAAEGSFSGGAGEEQFASFLTREHAAVLSRKLDLGFADVLARAAE